MFAFVCRFVLPLFLFALLALPPANGIGLPMQKMECCQQQQMCCAAPMQCTPSCGGCGRRRRREAAVQPLLRGKETPCPQTEWQQLMEKAIVPLDDVQSVNAVQKALLRRFPDNKFLVMCAMAGEGRTEGKETLPNEVHLSSSGHGYCNVVSDRIWCQAAAVVG
ncbi:hypothetical protein niasHT_016351 [Heterodera trifolii]|uniref:Uncharacterized protein n=1 Tax=Heterodera trifolii TaxID=157864 RepID=A0ABD2L006_9BILA